MLKQFVVVAILALFAVAPVLAYDKGDKGEKGGGGEKMVGAGLTLGKDGEKGDKGGGKPDKSFGMKGRAMSKDGGDKGEGKGGGKKGVIAPIDNRAMRSQKGIGHMQTNRGMDRGTQSMDQAMERGMAQNLDGLNR